MRCGDIIFIHHRTRDGRIRAKIVTIAPDVSGFVTKMYVSDNQKVKKGQLIFTILYIVKGCIDSYYISTWYINEPRFR